MNLNELSNVQVVQWCNSCNADEAVHVIEVELDWGKESLQICHGCLKELKKRGLL